MGAPDLRVSPSSASELRDLFQRELRHHRVFVSGQFDLADRERCALTIEHPSGATFVIASEAVYIKRDDPGAGAGLDLVGLDDAGMLAKLERFVNGAAAAEASEVSSRVADSAATALDTNESEPRTSDAVSSEARSLASKETEPQKVARNVHERVRQLSVREREVVGRSGMLTERVALERAFGGSVWEALLQNPQLTAPEVARIAKNGSLPVPLVNVIVSNASWLVSGEVRRALLGNPRVSGQNLDRVLRAFPKNELKQVAQMSAYRSEVRSAAQRLCGK